MMLNMMSIMFIMMSFFLLNFLFYISHPISLGIILVLYSVIIGIISMSISISWFLYMLVLVFLGGVMVLVIYMSTLSANEKFSPNFININLLSFFFIIMIFYFSNSLGNMKLMKNMSFINHLYEYSNITSMIFLMLYLLITMICVVKLVKFEEGPLIKRL